jgi:hypothetical protein
MKSTGHTNSRIGTINTRINQIQSLLNKSTIKPIVDYNEINTEYFENKTHDFKITDKVEHSFKDFMIEFKSKIEYIQSGTTGHTFKGISYKNNIPIEYAIKVVPYPKKSYGDIDDERRPENAEVKITKLLSYFIVMQQTPHIILPICTFYTDIEYFTDIDKMINNSKHDKYNEFIVNYNKNRYHNKVSVLVSEWANGGDLLDYLRANYKTISLLEWKIIFFQILSVLAVIQTKYPSFRHNDLKANNILRHTFQPKPKYISYNINNDSYKLPDMGFQIKITDFDFACISNVVENSKVNSNWASNYKISSKINRYYDIHFFFNTLIHFIKISGVYFMDLSCIPTEVKTFINSIIPLKYQKTNTEYVFERCRLIIDDEYTTPEIILKTNPFFEEFRNKKIKSYTGDTIKTQQTQQKQLGKGKDSFDIMTPFKKTENINNKILDIIKSQKKQETSINLDLCMPYQCNHINNANFLKAL